MHLGLPNKPVINGAIAHERYFDKPPQVRGLRGAFRLESADEVVMTKTLNRLLIGAIIAGLTGCDIAAADTTTPMERVTSVPRGQLKSPYPDFAGVAEQGHKLFQAYDCGGCHGGGGGGGMAAPLSDDDLRQR